MWKKIPFLCLALIQCSKVTLLRCLEVKCFLGDPFITQFWCLDIGDSCSGLKRTELPKHLVWETGKGNLIDNSINRTVYSVVHSVHCAVYGVQCTLYSVQCTV